MHFPSPLKQVDGPAGVRPRARSRRERPGWCEVLTACGAFEANLVAAGIKLFPAGGYLST
jgi:hypothetical protein